MNLHDVLQEAERLKAGCTPMSYWRYVQLGLVPRGRKVAGQGRIRDFDSRAIFALYAVALGRHIGLRPGHLRASAIRELAKALHLRTGGDSSRLPPVRIAVRHIAKRLEVSLRATWAEAVGRMPTKT